MALAANPGVALANSRCACQAELFLHLSAPALRLHRALGIQGVSTPSEPPCWLLPMNIRRHREGQIWEQPWHPAPQSGNSALTGWQGKERLVEMPPSPHFPSDLNASRWSPSWVLVGQGLVGWPQVYIWLGGG